MPVIYLALGSNVGDSEANIKKAIKLLSAKVKNIQQAPLYLSEATGYTEQPDFLNTAISGQTDLSPEKLLEFTDRTEQKVGRVKRFRWGPREIDIDIILYGKLVQKTEKLTVPHPYFRQRDFVLKPLTDLNPRLSDPVGGIAVRQLLQNIKPPQRSIIRKVD